MLEQKYFDDARKKKSPLKMRAHILFVLVTAVRAVPVKPVVSDSTLAVTDDFGAWRCVHVGRWEKVCSRVNFWACGAQCTRWPQRPARGRQARTSASMA
jgi:hypothetical protein